MARVKYNSDKKQQYGQFMTPINLSKTILKSYNFKKTDKILEPSMGDGSFIISIIEKFINEVYTNDISLVDKINLILSNNLYAVEIDEYYYEKCIINIKYYFNIDNINPINFINTDFLLYENYENYFDYIIGNPPFGGTIDMKHQESLDKKYGKRYNKKIKKETYSFFLLKCIELHLKKDGKLIFILSNTFMTIKTMHGLRLFLMNNGFSKITDINEFSKETDYSMVIIEYKNNDVKNYILYNNSKIHKNIMELTGNFSWYIPRKYSKYFNGETISDYMIGSGGLTTGKNEYFIKEINENNEIIEEYDFRFYDKKITLDDELSNARYNKLSDSKIKNIKELENNNTTKKDVKISKKDNPIKIKLPHDNYRYYNKSDGKILYSEPKYAIYWKDNGDAVITYKKNGRWHLRGVGGQKFYEKEGITWQMIASSIKPRYIDNNYIIDNGAPILILRNGVNSDELYFILAWLISNKSTLILKEVINHTRNIQAKDLERLPYPHWVNDDEKNIIIFETKKIINNIKNKRKYDLTDYIQKINKYFNEY